MSEEKFTLFWNGPFSQWYAAKFTVDGTTYTCAEQYMMAQKALVFGDKSNHKAIMQELSPKIQKSLGRKVANFNADKWNNVARDVVFKGNYAKFTSDPVLKKILLDTYPTTLVEASPVDLVWGIGLIESDPMARNRSNWLGKNWLGETLTKVRDQIMLDEKLGENV